MHHEDRAGVNALIRGIDTVAAEQIPVVVIMCTNRLDAIDPALQRRAVDIFRFLRPNDEQRTEILHRALSSIGFTKAEIGRLVEATGPREGRPGFTYSDLRQRLLPEILFDVFPDKQVEFDRAIEIAEKMSPTPALGGAQIHDGS
jgi:AAA+ superfamily predicted ATPase